MKKFWMALQFLTILPVKVPGSFAGKDLNFLLAWFPVAGAVMGLLPAVIVVAGGVLPQMALVAVALTAYTVLTGALHIDGFADTCDGIFSGRTKEQMLEIMRDSRIGTYGAAGVGLLLLLKFAFLLGLPQMMLWKMFILIPMFARWIQSLACAGTRYARTTGKAALFFQYATVWDVVLGGIFCLAVIFALLGMKGLCVFGAALLPAVLFIRFIEQKLGGMTGDTVGAASEIAELSGLFFGLVFLL
ncbi:MAG: adenosylcobinamide-GDP ribazoletransferase [Candidatus Omnitrophica bacterium]|nr:adenosylcobinamide-GDP ribazoletransferase [Candidatus Omnitrophota bacterium]